MGAAVGQDCALLEEVCGWINAKATVPVWAKMTPNITDIAQVRLLFSLFLLFLSYLLWFMCEEGRRRMCDAFMAYLFVLYIFFLTISH